MIDPKSDGGNADVQEKERKKGRLNAAYMHNPPTLNSKDRKKKALRGQVSREKKTVSTIYASSPFPKIK